MPKDFRMTQDGRIHLDRLVEGLEFIEQSLWIRLGLWVGDWFLNNAIFVEWSLAFETPSRLAELNAQIRETTLGTWGVTQITSYNLTETEGRGLILDFEVDTVYGPLSMTSQEITAP